MYTLMNGCKLQNMHCVVVVEYNICAVFVACNGMVITATWNICLKSACHQNTLWSGYLSDVLTFECGICFNILYVNEFVVALYVIACLMFTLPDTACACVFNVGYTRLQMWL